MANTMTRAEYLNKYSIRRYTLSDEAVRENELRVSDSYDLMAA